MKNFINVLTTAVTSTPIPEISGFGPFAFFKPLADAIAKGPLEGISAPINILLGCLDIFFILGIIATLVVLIFGLLRYHFKGTKAKDETVDFKQVEAERKQDLKRLIKSVIGLSIVFICLPVMVSIISAIVGACF